MIDRAGHGAEPSRVPPGPAGARRTPSGFRGPIVLGVEQYESCQGAAAVALTLARDNHAPLQLVPIREPSWESSTFDAAREGARGPDRRRAVGIITRVATEAAVPCVLTVEDDATVAGLLDHASAVAASLVVLGICDAAAPRPHTEHAAVLGIGRQASIPVLAVTSSMMALPAAAVAAIDFGKSSLDAALLAAAIVRGPGTLYLVHVQPDFDSALSRSEGVELRYGRAVMGSLTLLAQQLASPRGPRIVPVTLDGTVLDALTVFADTVGARVIAVGTRRGQLSGSGPLAHLGTSLVRQRRHTILLAPAGR